MTTSETPSLMDPTHAAPGHEGSASFNLSGQTVLAAWLISIAIHIVLFTTMLILVFPFAPYRETELPVTHTDFIGDIEGASLAPSQLPDLARPQNSTTPDPLRFAPRQSERLSELVTNRKRPELSIIGIGADRGDFSRYGLRVGGETGPVFFGAGGSSTRGARRIVYVVDRSGSMLDTFDYVREELRRSISALSRSQKFHVIFFNSGSPVESPPGRLVSAIRAQKQRFFEFLGGITPNGGTKPAPSMNRALANEPDLIYFLTDGLFDDSLIEQLDRWNEGRRTQIFTIAFVDRAGAALLERIAREHGGEFKYVSEDDLP